MQGVARFENTETMELTLEITLRLAQWKVIRDVLKKDNEAALTQDLISMIQLLTDRATNTIEGKVNLGNGLVWPK